MAAARPRDLPLCPPHPLRAWGAWVRCLRPACIRSWLRLFPVCGPGPQFLPLCNEDNNILASWELAGLQESKPLELAGRHGGPKRVLSSGPGHLFWRSHFWSSPPSLHGHPIPLGHFPQWAPSCSLLLSTALPALPGPEAACSHFLCLGSVDIWDVPCMARCRAVPLASPARYYCDNQNIPVSLWSISLGINTIFPPGRGHGASAFLIPAPSPATLVLPPSPCALTKLCSESTRPSSPHT